MMSVFQNLETNRTRQRAGPGFLGFVMIMMWFLLTVLSSSQAQAQDQAEAQETTPEIAVAPLILTPADILPDIEAALTAQGMDANAEIAFTNAGQQFVLPDTTVKIDHVSFNPLSGRFVLRLRSAPGAGAIIIAGTARTGAVFPVLTRAIKRGEMIDASDIVFVESAAPGAGAYITSADDLTGMQARRNLRAQTPLRAGDLSAPVLVNKGALVTLTYAIEGLRLSHQGVALGAGAKGDVISVRNVQSERILKAVIDGQNFVRVMSPRAPTQPLEG